MMAMQLMFLGCTMGGDKYILALLTTMPLKISSFSSRAATLKVMSRRAMSSSTDESITQVMRRDANEQMDFWIQRQHGPSDSNKKIPMIWNSRQEASSYVDKHIDAILLDCDGVLYRGLDVTPEAPEYIAKLMRKEKKLFFVTNNAGQNRQELRDKLARILDCPQLTTEQMISSSYSCAQYLKEKLLDTNIGNRVHVIGTEGLCTELVSTGFNVSGGNSKEEAGMSRDQLASYDFHSLDPINAVVVGLDTDFNYRKLCIANVLLQRNPEVLFVATNEDAFDLVGSDSRHLPGNGSLVKALEHASQRKAINVGKPSKILADLIQRQQGLDPFRSVFVGDRLDTDIRFGVEGGMVSVLVLTGCVTAQDLLELDEGTIEEPLPDIIVPYFGMLA
jgi:phosphoglycolate/pyridoxal phosphate phosphatase family enzyme